MRECRWRILRIVVGVTERRCWIDSIMAMMHPVSETTEGLTEVESRYMESTKDWSFLILLPESAKDLTMLLAVG